MHWSDRLTAVSGRSGSERQVPSFRFRVGFRVRVRVGVEDHVTVPLSSPGPGIKGKKGNEKTKANPDHNPDPNGNRNRNCNRNPNRK